MFAIPIRPATDDDAEAISALIRRTLRVSNAADYSVAEIDRVYAYFSVDGVRARIARQDVFVAEIDGRIVATVGYEKSELWALFVAPESQRLGLGTTLVEHVERHARKRGDRQLGLSASLTGVDFYERLGYRKLGYFPHPSGATYNMAKSLA